jgi:Iap family predicted aminopeptidase
MSDRSAKDTGRPSIDRIRKDIESLCQIRDRTPGSKNEKLAGRWIEERLMEMGFDRISKTTTRVCSWEPVSCKVRVTAPVTRDISATMFPYCQSAQVNGVLTSIDQAGSRNHGMIGVAAWGSQLYLSATRTYYQALKQDFSAVLISCPDNGSLLKVVVIEGGVLRIPVVSISKEDGEFLHSLMEKSDVTIEIECRAGIDPNAETTDLEAVLDGGEEDGLEVCIGAHYDAWFAGAADNAAPVAVVLELANLAKAHVRSGGSFRRRVRFLFFGAEEAGSPDKYYYWLNGSRAYVESNVASLGKLAVMLSLDSTGFPAPARNIIASSVELSEYAKSVKVSAKIPPNLVYYSPAGYGSDHWFFETSGVPTLYAVSFPSRLYHTQGDVPENLDYEAIHFYADFMKSALQHFADSDLLPIDVFSIFQRAESLVSEYSRLMGNPFDLGPVLNGLVRLNSEKKAFDRVVRSVSKQRKVVLVQRLNQFLLETANRFNRTIGWLWRRPAPPDVDYLFRLELIPEYIDLNASISALRKMPIVQLDYDTIKRYESQSDFPYNWVGVHEPLAKLEEERTRLFRVIEDELHSLSEMLDSVWRQMKELERLIEP